MIKRSEFGFKEWLEFMPTIPHQFDREKATCSLWYRGIWHNAEHYGITMDSAARGNIEFFCKTTNIPLPWEPDKPDFSTWSRDECEDYIYSQKCLFATRFDTLESDVESTYTAIAICINGFGAYFGSPEIPPTLKDYQKATEWLWEQVNKQEK